MQQDFQNTEKSKTEPQVNVEESKIDETKEFALIMKGGGAKGLAYIGAIQVLEQYGYKFTWFVGTSAGAITAVLLAAGYSAHELVTELETKNFKDFRDVTFLKLIPNILFRRGVFSGDNLKNWIESTLNKKLKLNQDIIPIKLGQLHNDNKNRLTIYAATKNVNAKDFDSHSLDTKDTDAAWAVRASASIPYFFTRTYSQDGYVFDGGLSHNYPIDVFLTKYNEDKKLNFLGLYLGKSSATYNESGSTLSDLLDNWLTGNDKTGLIKYGKQTIVIDPTPITTLRFNLTDTEKEFLLATGKASALDYLSRQERTKAHISENDVKKATDEVSELRRKVVIIHKESKRKMFNKSILATLFLALVIILLGLSYYLNKKESYTENPEAMRYYMLGKEEKEQDDSPESFNSAIESFSFAIFKDPKFVLPLIEIGESFAYQEDHSGTSPEKSLKKAEEYIKEAEKLNDSLQKIYATWGFIKMNLWEWEEAESKFTKALKLSDINQPEQTANAHYLYAKLLRTEQRYDEALKHLEEAERLSPKFGNVQTNLGMLYLRLGDFKTATDKFNHANRLQATPATYCWLAVANILQPNPNKTEATDNVDICHKEVGFKHDSMAFVGFINAKIGQTEKAYEVIKSLETLYNSTPTRSANAVDIAMIYAGLEKKDEAFDWLNKAFKDRSGILTIYIVMPIFDSLKGDSRYNLLLNKLNLSVYEKH